MPGQFGNIGATDQFRDLGYSCAPVGVGYPGASFFWRSTNIGQTWRLPPHDPIIGFFPPESGGGGGDCHIVIGQLTHKVFFVDLPVGCVTMNISSDLGQTFTTDRVACGDSPGAIDDRQWVEADESTSLPSGTTGNVYVSFIHVPTGLNASIDLARSTHDGTPGSFVTASICNALTDESAPTSQNDTPPCPAP